MLEIILNPLLKMQMLQKFLLMSLRKEGIFSERMASCDGGPADTVVTKAHIYSLHSNSPHLVS